MGDPRELSEDGAAWRRARTEPRVATDDVPPVRGIGSRRLQVIVCPAFEDARAWEVRQRHDVWFLFRPRVIAPWPTVRLVGYDPVPIASEVLAGFYRRVTALSLPLAPYLNDRAGLDGTVSQVAAFGSLWSEWRFQWWSEPPPQWQPLVALTAEMLSAFSAVEAGPA